MVLPVLRRAVCSVVWLRGVQHTPQKRGPAERVPGLNHQKDLIGETDPMV